MSRRGDARRRRGSAGGGGLGWSLFVKDHTANLATPEEILFYQVWGFTDPPVAWESIDEGQPLTEAELYDQRNGLCRFWDPRKGREVKVVSHPDWRIARDMEAEVALTLALAVLPILTQKR